MRQMFETIRGQTAMSASSPDEQAFMSAAEYFGFEFVGRDIENGLVIVVDKRTSERFDIEVRAARRKHRTRHSDAPLRYVTPRYAALCRVALRYAALRVVTPGPRRLPV